MKKQVIELLGICYVLVQTDAVHPITYQRHDLIWYPERAMGLLDCVNYKPYIGSVVTENPWIASCYPRENVRVWDEEYGWIMPDFQTYGASVNKITMCLFGIRDTIPAQVMDGGKNLEKHKKNLERIYKKAK